MKNILLLFFFTSSMYAQPINDSLQDEYQKYISKINSSADSTKVTNYCLSPNEFDSIAKAMNNKEFHNNGYTSEQYKYSLWLSLSILFFGLVVILGILYNLNKQDKGWGPNSVQILSITLLIVAGLFLVTAGYSQQQITPIVGLLGTIAGYLLGKSNKE